MVNTRTTTAPIWSEAARRLPDPVRVAGLALGALALDALLARGVVGEGLSKPILLFLGVAAIAFVLRFPLATAFVFLGLTDFVFYPTFFAFELGPLSIRPHELALAGLLALALIRPERESWGGPAGLALAAFLGMLALAGGLAVLDGKAALTDVFNWGRPFGLLTFFYVVVRLFPRPDQRRALLTGAAVLAGIAGGVALLVALGAGFGDTLAGGGESIVKEEEGAAGLLRVRLAGLSAAYALFWYVRDPARRRPPRAPDRLGAGAERDVGGDSDQLQPQHVAGDPRRAGADAGRSAAPSCAAGSRSRWWCRRRRSCFWPPSARRPKAACSIRSSSADRPCSTRARSRPRAR